MLSYLHLIEQNRLIPNMIIKFLILDTFYHLKKMFIISRNLFFLKKIKCFFLYKLFFQDLKKRLFRKVLEQRVSLSYLISIDSARKYEDNCIHQTDIQGVKRSIIPSNFTKFRQYFLFLYNNTGIHEINLKDYQVLSQKVSIPQNF